MTSVQNKGGGQLCADSSCVPSSVILSDDEADNDDDLKSVQKQVIRDHSG